MDDNSIMPFGQFKGRKLKDVPDAYLLWLSTRDDLNKDLRDYLEDNEDVLLVNVQRQKIKESYRRV